MRIFLIKNYFLIGSVFIILGVAIWGYGYHTISTLEESLKESLTLEERWTISGSQQWWKITQITVLNPVSVVLVCLGTIFVAYWFVHLIMPITIERIKR